MKLLGKEVNGRRTVGKFYVAVVQAVILFGLETWVINPCLEKSLKGFHHYAVQWMAVMVLKCQRDGTWLYPPTGAALEMLGLYDIGVYIFFCKNTVAQYIATFPIMNLCLAAERKPGL